MFSADFAGANKERTNKGWRVNMDNTNFLYWLQGFFELNQAGGNIKVLDLDHIECIQRQIVLISKKTAWQSTFITWLDGLFSGAQLQISEGKTYPILTGLTAIIYERLKREIKEAENIIPRNPAKPIQIPMYSERDSYEKRTT